MATREHGDIHPCPEPRGDAGDRSSRIGLWMLCAVFALSYGSLIPFDLERGMQGGVAKWSYHSPCWVLGGPEDIIANIIVYMPIGWLVAWFVRTRYPSAFVGVVLAGAACLGLSAGLECAQAVVRSRVASWWDVLLNTGGGLLGAVLALSIGRRLLAFAECQLHRAKRNLPATAATVLTVAVIAVSFLPSGLIVTTSGLRNAFLHANWRLPFAVSANPEAGWATGLTGHLNEMIWFVLLAYVSFRASRRGHASVGHSVFRTLQHVTIVAVLIEFLQLFASGHVFSMTDILIRCAAGTLGVAVAILVAEVYVARRAARASAVKENLSLRSILAGIGVIALLGIYGWRGQAGFEGLEALRVRWCPFVEVWRGPFAAGLITGAATLILYGGMCGAARSLLQRAAMNCSSLVLVIWVGSFATAAETLTAMMTNRAADTTTPVLAIIGAAAASSLFTRLNERGDPMPARLR